MKKMFIYSLLILFASCTTNNSNTNTASTPSTVGTYKLTEENVADAVDLNNDGVYNTNLVNETTCYQGFTFYFKSDGTCQSITKNVINYSTYPSIASITCTTPFIIDNATWVETPTTVTTINTSGGHKNWIKEGSNLRYKYTGGSFLWTKQ